MTPCDVTHFMSVPFIHGSAAFTSLWSRCCSLKRSTDVQLRTHRVPQLKGFYICLLKQRTQQFSRKRQKDQRILLNVQPGKPAGLRSSEHTTSIFHTAAVTDAGLFRRTRRDTEVRKNTHNSVQTQLRLVIICSQSLMWWNDAVFTVTRRVHVGVVVLTSV